MEELLKLPTAVLCTLIVSVALIVCTLIMSIFSLVLFKHTFKTLHDNLHDENNS